MFCGSFTGFSWTCLAAPGFSCNCNVLQMLWLHAKQREEKLVAYENHWIPLLFVWWLLISILSDLLVITVEDTGWMYSAHLTQCWQRAILCKPQCVVLPVNWHLQSSCVWFMSLLVTIDSKILLSQTLHWLFAWTVSNTHCVILFPAFSLNLLLENS